MNSAQLKAIGIVVVVLLIALIALEMRSGSDTSDREYLLPTLQQFANEVDRVTVLSATNDAVELQNVDGHWLVMSRDRFRADETKVRALLVAMSEARIVEAKTANPELHSRLGVDVPDNDAAKGIRVTASGVDQTVSVIFGNVAQTSYRYARVAAEDQSWLVDQNPDFPDDVSGWLDAEIADVATDRVRQVRIQHSDGEVVAIGKLNEEDENFEVYDIPNDRELSYATVANGIAGGLSDLRMDDVRRAPEDPLEDVVSYTLETFDGLTIVAESVVENDENWVTFSVTGAESSEDTELAARVAGWQFKLPDHKGNMLKRRFEDILKAPPVAE